jgi:hypothetical protein
VVCSITHRGHPGEERKSSCNQKINQGVHNAK